MAFLFFIFYFYFHDWLPSLDSNTKHSFCVSEVELPSTSFLDSYHN